MEEPKASLAELRAQVEALCEAYNAGEPLVDDGEYDALLARLRRLESEAGVVDPTSPSSRVTETTTAGFEKRDHGVPMLSLDNAHSVVEVLSFFGGKLPPVVVEPKFDGLSLSLRYDNGRLMEAVTRGDGQAGDVVTMNVRQIDAPQAIQFLGKLEIRGEVVMARSTFNQLNTARLSDGDQPFSNPRNAAAGSLKLHDPAEVARRQLRFIAYAALDNSVKTQFEMLELLRKLGFSTPLAVPLDDGSTIELVTLAVDEHDLKDALDRVLDLRDVADIDLDGAVIKADQLELQASLGLGTRSPKWAVAFKFPPETKSTRLNDIVLTVGRTGQITPNAVLEPVYLSGAVVKAASLCNADELTRLGVNVGDLVNVSRSCEVIPKIVGVAEKRSAGTWAMPEVCPTCTARLVRVKLVHHFCPNHACPDQVIGQLLHAVSKPCLDWDGFGKAQAEAVCEAGFTNLAQVMGMTEAQVRVVLKPAAAKKFLAERERVKTRPLWRKLHALGIEGLGKTTCQELARRYPSIVSLAEAPPGELAEFVGKVKAGAITRGLVELADEIEQLDELGLSFEDHKPSQPAVGGCPSLAGKVVVITGILTAGTRDHVSRWLEGLGATVKSSVGRGTDYLLVGEGGGARKAENAQKFGTACLSEEEFYALVGDHPDTPAALSSP